MTRIRIVTPWRSGIVGLWFSFKISLRIEQAHTRLSHILIMIREGVGRRHHWLRLLSASAAHERKGEKKHAFDKLSLLLLIEVMKSFPIHRTAGAAALRE